MCVCVCEYVYVCVHVCVWRGGGGDERMRRKLLNDRNVRKVIDENKTKISVAQNRCSEKKSEYQKMNDKDTEEK